jgi:hypothetical protein
MKYKGLFLVITLIFIAATAAPLAATPSMAGPTGGFLIPDTQTLRPEVYNIGVHGESFREVNRSTAENDTSYDIGFKLNAGVYDNLEIGMEQTIRSSSDYRNDELTLNIKYRLPVETFNLSLGGTFATGGEDYHSAYLIGGWKALYGGFGFNFGGDRLRELNTSTIARFGTAKFGGYNLRRIVQTSGSDTYIGEPDEFFALVGVNFKISEYFNLLMDFNGDRFAAGFRVALKDFNIDVAYIGQSEVDSLLDRVSDNVVVGAGLCF